MCQMLASEKMGLRVFAGFQNMHILTQLSPKLLTTAISTSSNCLLSPPSHSCPLAHFHTQSAFFFSCAIQLSWPLTPPTKDTRYYRPELPRVIRDLGRPLFEKFCGAGRSWGWLKPTRQTACILPTHSLAATWLGLGNPSVQISLVFAVLEAGSGEGRCTSCCVRCGQRLVGFVGENRREGKYSSLQISKNKSKNSHKEWWPSGLPASSCRFVWNTWFLPWNLNYTKESENAPPQQLLMPKSFFMCK